MMNAGKIGRREFLQQTGTVLALSSASVVSMAQTTGRPVRFGLIGCGGRGRSVATSMVQNADAQIVALADLFGDKLASTKQHFDSLLQKRSLPPIDPSRLYKGANSGAQLAHSDVDAVLIAITPYFYPDVLEAVAPAGKHIYCEKPVATDVAGCLRVLDLGHRIDGKLVFHVGLNVPSSPAMKEMVRRIHAGAIGDIVTGQSFFYWSGGDRQRPAGVSHAEALIRTWSSHRVLSGDYIVEQNVHGMDKLNWVLRDHPIAAEATGGRKVKKGFGDNWDHYLGHIYYPGGVTVSFQSTQFLKGWRDAGERFFGTLGVSESHYEGPVRILGEQSWDAGVKEILTEANIHNVRDFVSDIRAGNFRNDTRRGVEATLTAILVRTAAYQGKKATWDKMVSSNERWDAHIDLEKLG